MDTALSAKRLGAVQECRATCLDTRHTAVSGGASLPENIFISRVIARVQQAQPGPQIGLLLSVSVDSAICSRFERPLRGKLFATAKVSNGSRLCENSREAKQERWPIGLIG